MAAIRLVRVSPWNVRLPVAISYKTHPSAKMSVRASASRPSSCSGDMYWNVPTIVPSCVSGFATVASEAPMLSLIPVPVFARPKSSSFAPVFVNMTLPGFRSR